MEKKLADEQENPVVLKRGRELEKVRNSRYNGFYK